MKQRILMIVGDVGIELLELLLAHLRGRAGPDRLHRIEGILTSLRLGEVIALLLLHDGEANRVGDEIRVPRDDLPERPLLGVVGEPVLGISRLEAHLDGGARRLTLGLLQGVLTAAVGLPERGALLPGPATQNANLLCHHEAGVEAHTELADQFGRRVPCPFGVAQELQGSRAGDGPQVLHQFIPRHPDPVVLDGKRAGFGIYQELDLQLVFGENVGVGEPFEAQAIQGVGGVGNQLAHEDVFVRIEGVDHEVEEFLDLGLEFVGLAGHAVHSWIGRPGGGGRRNV